MVGLFTGSLRSKSICETELYLLNHRKGKGGEIEMAEGVGNPVYDSFNEGQPLEDVSSLFLNMDM